MSVEHSIDSSIGLVLGVRTIYHMDKYLGLPPMVGKSKRKTFQHYKDHFRRCVDSWNLRYLSHGGKCVFIHSVLQAIPTFAMQCFLFPSSLCRALKGILNRFWWQKLGCRWGSYWCSWSALSAYKCDRGMGFHDLAQFNIAHLAK
ncbi:hypothetical protein J1N35_043619 [Gossypium stocksii]|uniref:Uncharacterized protein n=1 Tax=Gossypium stocksii TaxID=47602 RepID=A0A9D3ZF85_9ROSI|nr:hypothetical protein J1N35_043619 [Gossypium stocksii]